eukprot:381741-Heterocapsa_arctica.AAC.1
MARRSLMNNAKPTLQESAAWMTRHGVTHDDINGQSLWNQALDNWSPKITVGCTVPHFLRTSLVAQHGPGVTSGTLQHETKGPKLDLEHDPRERGPAS